MIFSKATIYGIRAMTRLATQPVGSSCGLREIATAEQIPPDYLRKVLSELRRHHLIRAARGIHGGYALAGNPNQVTLWDVFRVLEPEPELESCLLGHDGCDAQSDCPLYEDWQQVREKLLALLKNKTISQLAENSHHPHSLPGNAA
ncbi:MAG: Rrf2 family transcriptional regulator [Blastocatellia bacterium]|nr:Rrf2 family transcriptional regulator [Blastocatellia bacterium]